MDQKPVVPETDKKKNIFNKKPIIITVIVIVVTALISGAIVWYVASQSANNAKTANDNKVKALNEQTKINLNKIKSLESQVASLSKDKGTASEETPAALPSATTNSDSDKAKQFCNTVDSGAYAYTMTYYENDDGKFVFCQMSLNDSPVGGYAIWGKNISGTWTKVATGQEAPSESIIQQYKLPQQ